MSVHVYYTESENGKVVRHEEYHSKANKGKNQGFRGDTPEREFDYLAKDVKASSHKVSIIVASIIILVIIAGIVYSLIINN